MGINFLRTQGKEAVFDSRRCRTPVIFLCSCFAPFSALFAHGDFSDTYRTPLIRAAYACDANGISAALKTGASPQQKNEYGKEVIRIAIDCPTVTPTKVLVSAGIDIRGQAGASLLAYAISSHRDHNAEYLIGAGTAIDDNHEGANALAAAIRSHDEGWVDYLLSRGVDPNLTSPDSHVPLIFPHALYASDSILRKLFHAGLRLQGSMAKYTVRRCASENRKAALLVLFENGIPDDLIAAVIRRDSKAVAALLAAGASVADQDDTNLVFRGTGELPDSLYFAIRDIRSQSNLPASDEVEAGRILRLLLQQKPDLERRYRSPGLQYPNSQTALMIAVVDKRFDAIRPLQKAGARTNVRDRCGDTAHSLARDLDDVDKNRGLKELGDEAVPVTDVRSLIREKKTDEILRTFNITDLVRCQYGYRWHTNGEMKFETFLGDAIREGLTRLVEAALHAGADVNAGARVESTPLFIALDSGHPHIALMLLNAGARSDRVNHFHQGALYFAAEKGYAAVIERLIAKHAAVNTGYCPITALDRAIEFGDAAIVRTLIAAGARHRVRARNCTQSGYMHPLLRAESNASETPDYWRRPMSEIELRQRRDILQQVSDLIAAYYRDRLAKIESGKARVEERDLEGLTLLMEAALDQQSWAVERLLELKADARAEVHRNGGALFFAIEARDAASVRALLKAKVDPNQKRYNDETPLMLAAAEATPEIVALLLESGADPMVKDKYSRTAISRAADRLEHNRLLPHARLKIARIVALLGGKK